MLSPVRCAICCMVNRLLSMIVSYKLEYTLGQARVLMGI